jgi:Domain of unknown function (DUF397)
MVVSAKNAPDLIIGLAVILQPGRRQKRCSSRRNGYFINRNGLAGFGLSNYRVGSGWGKFSRSGGSGGACIEAGSLPGRVVVRDTTQHGDGPVLSVSPSGRQRFTASIR